MKSRLFRKIFAAYAVVFLFVIVLDTWLVASRTRQDISRRTREELTTGGRVMLLVPQEQIVKNIRPLSRDLKARITLVGALGAVSADSEEDSRKMDNHINRPEIQEARVKGWGSSVRYSQTLQIDMMYVAFPVQVGGQIAGYIRLAKPLQEVKSAIGQFYRFIARLTLVILSFFLLLALLIIPKFISPLLRITAYTERVRKQGARGSLLVHSHDEMGQLADNINLLVQSYEDNIRIAVEEREKLASVFTSMMEGIVIVSRENRIEFVNRGASDILGGQYAGITGKTVMEAFRNAELQNALDRCCEEEKPVSQEISLGHHDQQIIVGVNIAPIKGSPGTDQKKILVFHDVTQLRKLERIRADFVANVTHEIKTPLTAIIGFVQTLQEGALEDHRQALKFLGIIREHALRLNRLVDDLLTLSSIELGEVKLHLEKLDARKAVLQALAVIEEKAKEKGLAISWNWPDDLPPILADADAVIQILVNVLDNAVKFTSQGSIVVSISVEEKGYSVITVADTGIGIPAHEISRLGERFYRVDKMRSRELGGTGLGLSIVKHLLSAQKGWMKVESKPGAGTAVKLFLPFYTTGPAEAKAAGQAETS